MFRFGVSGMGAPASACECNKGFSNSYMLLKPEEVKFLDLLRLLFSSNIKKRKFVDSSHDRQHNLWHRFFIFLSIIVLKLLRLFANPLAFFGFVLQSCLNFYSANRGFSGMLLNILLLKGLKFPESSSAEYLSVIGHLDSRVTLDKSIKPGDVNYIGALCMMTSKIVYENEAYVTKIVKDVWGMEFLGFFNFWNDYQEKCSTQAFMMRDKNVDHDTIVVSFRGTEPFNADDWSSDFDISWYEIKGIGKIHGGFMKALGLQKSVGWPKETERLDERRRPLAYYTLRKRLRKLLKENERTRFVVTGHSLGGALAILFPSILAFHEENLLLERLEGIYTFGQPRVGDGHFGKFMMKTLSQYKIRYYRFVYGFDLVPRLPLDDKAFMFKHFGPCIYFEWNYVAQILEEEPFKNYFSIVGAVLMRIHACFEIGKSLTIGWIKGKEYEERAFFRMVRLFGLLFPGIPAHCPQDYVNSTRLGSTGSLLSEYDVKIH